MFIHIYTIKVPELPRSSSIYLHSISIPSHRLTWKCPCRTTFSAKLGACILNLGSQIAPWIYWALPPSFQSVPKTKPAWCKKLSVARKEGVLLQPGTLAHTYPSSLEPETGGQSPANYPYCRRRFTSQRVWVPGEPCASFFWPKNMLVVQENSDAQLPDRASYSNGTEGVVAHQTTRFTSNISVISGTNS